MIEAVGSVSASDTQKVVAKNRRSKTWINWWEVKLGLHESEFQGNKYTEAGNKYEHPILQSISEDIRLDHQIKLDKILLRVNYDGDKNGIIYEVKTHRAEKEFEVTKAYWQQAQVEMYAYQKVYDDFKKLYIVSYGLYPEEYGVNEAEVDLKRVRFTEVEYDKDWIKSVYLPNVKELSRYLKKGKFPS